MKRQSSAVAIAFLLATTCRADQPAISLSVKDATLRDTTTALAKAIGVPLAVSARNVGSTKRYTLEVKDQPFWEVFKALSTQGELRLTDGPASGPQLVEEEPGWHTFHQNGDLVAIPGEIRFMDSSSLQPADSVAAGRAARGTRGGAPAAPGELTMRIDRVFDPRVNLVHVAPSVRVLRAVDDAGNVLLQQNALPIAAWTFPAGSVLHWGTATIRMTVPARPGTKIASMEGYLQCEIIEGKTFEITDLEKMASQDYDGNGSRVHINSVTTQPRVAISGTSQGGTLMICDSEGRIVRSATSLGPTFNITVPISPAVKPPLRAVIVAGQLKQQTIPFHFADLPLPVPRGE